MVFIHQRRLQRSGIHSHPDRDILCLCRPYHFLELLLPAYISGVDTYLVRAVLYRCQRALMIKMYIRHQRDVYMALYLIQSLCRSYRRHSTAYYLAAFLFKFKYLLYRGLRILCGCIGHGLDQYGAASAYHTISDLYLFCFITKCHVFLLMPPP